ncbi:MAG TPA: DUF1819 family protein [Epulopiscium sp.]|nr:DUF1819 family protein [Candidatus Epulonipiscium sp.]
MEKYSSGIAAESFWFVEFRQIIQLRYDGKSWDDIKDLCINDNLLGVTKEYRAKRIYGNLKRRVDALGEELIAIFMGADVPTQKIINIFSMAKINRLFFEFLYELYREKIILGVTELEDSDINIFLKNKQDQHEDISKWTDVTMKRLRSTYVNFLRDAGLLTVIDKQKTITPPILDIVLENYLKDNGENQMLKAIRGLD